MIPAKVDGIFAMNIDGFYVENITIQYNQPKEDYHGNCLNFSNITQLLKTNIQCRDKSNLTKTKKKNMLFNVIKYVIITENETCLI